MTWIIGPNLFWYHKFYTTKISIVYSYLFISYYRSLNFLLFIRICLLAIKTTYCISYGSYEMGGYLKCSMWIEYTQYIQADRSKLVTMCSLNMYNLNVYKLILFKLTKVRFWILSESTAPSNFRCCFEALSEQRNGAAIWPRWLIHVSIL